MQDLCKIKKLTKYLYDFERDLKKTTGLTLNEAFCLCSLIKEPKKPYSLSDEIGISVSRISRILNSLHKKKMISRKVSGNDKREKDISVTAAGTDKYIKLKSMNISVPKLYNEEEVI